LEEAILADSSYWTVKSSTLRDNESEESKVKPISACKVTTRSGKGGLKRQENFKMEGLGDCLDRRRKNYGKGGMTLAEAPMSSFSDETEKHLVWPAIRRLPEALLAFAG
jgi:hypothetical protein